MQEQVREVQGIMQQNIELVMRNTDTLENIEDKTEILSESAKKFKDGGQALERKMRCRYYKVTLLIALVVLAVLAYILIPLIKPAFEGN